MNFLVRYSTPTLRESSAMKIDLHLVSWNRFPMTELVIKTIHRNTNPNNFRLVLLDNGSEGDTPLKLAELHDNGLIDEYIPLKTNLGLEAARNFLLKNCTLSPYFICVDNDCLPPPISEDGYDWVERLLNLINAYEDYAAIACRTQVMIGTGNIFEEADEHGDDLVDFPHPGGSLRIMNTQAVLEVRGWDRELPGRGSEERYICDKLHHAGYKTAFAARIPTLHLFGPPTTDPWGYPKAWVPEASGHNPGVWHPVFASGDDFTQVENFSGKELARAYADSCDKA